MTSDRQRRANLANAKSSTGPKTVPGRVRSAQNALRHGLNVSVLSDPALAPLAEEMARKIAGSDADAEAVECARQIAEAQIDLNRVRDSRRRLIEGEQKLAAVIEEKASQLAALDRYERRALSRRKFAIRKFDANVCCHSGANN